MRPRHNYFGIASLLIFVCAVALPFLLMLLVHGSDFRSFARSQGPGLTWIIVLWIGSLSVVGMILSTVGLVLSYRGYGGRAASIVGLALNMTFLILQLRNIGL